jgi:short-subunit dehydrogenase
VSVPARVAEPQRIVITGASSGIGRALAQEYARSGAVLGLIARRAQALNELAASLPTRSYTYPLDVRDATALASAAADFMGRVGVPDIVIANAGVSAGNDTGDPVDNTAFEEIVGANLTGIMLTFQPFVAAMCQAQRGTLAGIASVAGFRGLPGASAYSASKAGAIAYLESLRVELRPKGIKVVTICPGYIATPMTARNSYRMPFLMKVEDAAPRIVRAIAARKRLYVLPWQMAIIGWVLRRMPRPLYDLAFSRAPRKARRPPA